MERQQNKFRGGVSVELQRITGSVSFAESAATGSTVLEIDPDSLASREIMALAKEILGQQLKEAAA